MAGELGEAVERAFEVIALSIAPGKASNLIKKLERERLGIAGSRASLSGLADELADVVICVDLITMQAGIDLMGAAVPAKFNATSEKVGLRTRLVAEPAVIETEVKRAAALIAALTPSADTKAEYDGKFSTGVTLRLRNEEETRHVEISWNAIMRITAAIRSRADQHFSGVAADRPRPHQPARPRRPRQTSPATGIARRPTTSTRRSPSWNASWSTTASCRTRLRSRGPFSSAPPRPDLDALVEEARAHTMPKAESEAQRASWVRGEMRLDRKPEVEADHG